MLGFVTSLRHPDNMKSPARVGRLLDVMLRTVCRQDDPDLCVVVVHAGLPDLAGHDPRVTLLEVGFPAPSPRGEIRIDYRQRMQDKGAKLTVGAARARDLGASHIMFFDYDDLAHRGLSALANAQPDAAGWYSPTGFVHTRGFRWVTRVADGFHQKCGSSSIVRCDLMGLPATIPASASIGEVIRQVGDDYAIGFVGEHSRRPELVEQRGGRLEPMPFPSAIWEIGSGENVSGSLIAGGVRLPIDARIEADYGLAPPGPATVVAANVGTTWRRAARLVRPWNN